jgi:hypothetical protein
MVSDTKDSSTRGQSMKKIDAAVDEAVDEDSVSNHSRECLRTEKPAIIYE